MCLTGFGCSFFHKIKPLEFHVKYLTLFCIFLVINSFLVVLDEKSSYEYPDNAGVPQDFSLDPTY